MGKIIGVKTWKIEHGVIYMGVELKLDEKHVKCNIELDMNNRIGLKEIYLAIFNNKNDKRKHREKAIELFNIKKIKISLLDEINREIYWNDEYNFSINEFESNYALKDDSVFK